MQIVTNFPGGRDSSWAPFVTYVEPPRARSLPFAVPGGRFIRAFSYALKLHGRLRHSDFAIIAESTLEGRMLCVLNALMPGRRRPIFLYECLWDPPGSALKKRLHRLYLRILESTCIGYVVFSVADVESYAREFPVRRSRLIAIPYCTTLSNYQFDERDDGFVFAGGDSLRDYRALAEAVRDLPHRVVIATGLQDPFGGSPCPRNVTAKRVSHDEFRRLMATASIHVVPLASGTVRSVGHQTYLNGMAMGKPVIVTDTRGTPEYIEHGVDGVLVEPGDHQALRQWIVSLMDSQEERSRIGARAREKAALFSGSRHLERVLKAGVDAYQKSKYMQI